MAARKRAAVPRKGGRRAKLRSPKTAHASARRRAGKAAHRKAPQGPQAPPTPAATAPIVSPPAAPDPASVHLENHDAFAALASHARYQILDSLAQRPKSIAELTRELKVHRLTLRYHIGFLLREGLVEESQAPRAGKAGRPATLYRTARHARVPGFPPRRFELIAQAALTTLLEALGQGDAQKRLYLKGQQVGAGVVRGIAAAKGVRSWTPSTFDAHILKGSYREMGVSTEVLASTADSLRYRAFGCPFLELAEQMPDVVCDALDQGFHDGVDEALGGARTERLRCMGHGDPYCEYLLTWGPAAPRGPPSPAAPQALKVASARPAAVAGLSPAAPLRLEEVAR